MENISAEMARFGYFPLILWNFYFAGTGYLPSSTRVSRTDCLWKVPVPAQRVLSKIEKKNQIRVFRHFRLFDSFEGSTLSLGFKFQRCCRVSNMFSFFFFFEFCIQAFFLSSFRCNRTIRLQVESQQKSFHKVACNSEAHGSTCSDLTTSPSDRRTNIRCFTNKRNLTVSYKIFFANTVFFASTNSKNSASTINFFHTTIQQLAHHLGVLVTTTFVAWSSVLLAPFSQNK